MEIDVNQFLNGAITKAISVPGTYTELEPPAHGCCRRLHLDGHFGTINGADIMVFYSVLVA